MEIKVDQIHVATLKAGLLQTCLKGFGTWAESAGADPATLDGIRAAAMVAADVHGVLAELHQAATTEPD